MLHDRPLLEGFVLEETSRFGDDIWRLHPAMHKRHERSIILRFSSVPARYQPVARELFYAMLSGPLPPDEQRHSLNFIRSQFTEAVRFLGWLDARDAGTNERRALSTLTGTELVDYQHHLLAVLPSSPNVRACARAFVRSLWRWRRNLSTDGLRFDPQHLDGWGEPDRRRRGENTTERIPQIIHGPLFVWALRFVDDFSADILAGEAAWRTRMRCSSGPIGGGNTHKNIRHALQELLDDHVARGLPLPGHNGEPSILQFANLLGCCTKSVYRCESQIDAAFAIVGATSYTTLATPIAATCDGRPWIEGIATHHCHDHGIAVLARMLHIACYVVIAFLSGMRDSEIKHLRRGCLRVERDPEGIAYRWKIASLAFKGERGPVGVPATWVVGQPAARAVQVLEALQPPDTDQLFAHLRHGSGAKATQNATSVLTTSTTNLQMNDFVTWVNRYCAARASLDGIPEVNAQPWRLQTSQFRRTLAWFIARRPGGTIAGALQYRHHGVQMFEGYAGTSESGFRAEVESEQALARGEQLMAMVDTQEHLELAGPAADEAVRRLELFGVRAHFQGTVVVDPPRLRRLMRKQDPAIYPGKYITCVHDHTKALCERAKHGASEGLPDHGGCQALHCQNVALTAENVAAVHAELESVDRRLTTPPALPPLLEHRLQARRSIIQAFLARHAARTGVL